MIRAAIDTNVLVYAEGVNGDLMQKAALDLIRKIPEERCFLPVQVLGELFHILVRKAGQTPKNARSAIMGWQEVFPLIETSPEVFVNAIDLAVHHQFRIWDAIILSAASSAGCRLLLSEDLQAGFTWNGVTVIDPFAAKKDELLARLLAGE
jgi:predicted nucleic acid-binding protein